MAPGKDILVLFKEGREHLMNGWTGEGGNPSCLLKSKVIEKYVFQLLNKLCNRPLLFYAQSL